MFVVGLFIARAAKKRVSEKRREGRRGEPVNIFLNSSMRPPRVNMSKCARADSREFAG